MDVIATAVPAVGVLILAALALAFYFLPAICGRAKQNAGAIFVLNLLLGWTLIGWVVALVWALTVDSSLPSQEIKQWNC